MTPDAFVDAVKNHVIGSGVRGVMKSLVAPPERNPTSKRMAATEWYNALGDEHRGYVENAVRDAAHASVFGLLCVLDGVRVIETGEKKSEFRLVCICPDGTEAVLNPSNGEMLHDILNAK